jgi:hypothetical protein
MLHSSDVSSGQWKRPRDDYEAMEHEDSWHHSSKRVKVMDERDSGNTAPLHRQQPYAFSKADCHGTPQQQAIPVTEYQQQQQEHQLKQQEYQRQQQNAGQRSSERQSPLLQETKYQNMNSLLGSLHLARRRQRATDSGVHQPSSQQVPPSNVYPTRSHHPGRPQASRNKVCSLRVDSKLY